MAAAAAASSTGPTGAEGGGKGKGSWVKGKGKGKGKGVEGKGKGKGKGIKGKGKGKGAAGMEMALSQPTMSWRNPSLQAEDGESAEKLSAMDADMDAYMKAGVKGQ